MTIPTVVVEALVATPDDPAPYQVAGDVLVQAGDPWGELIAVQCQLQNRTDPGEFLALRRRSDALLAANGVRWTGTLGARVAWRWGFIEHLALDDARDLPRVLATEPGRLIRSLELRGNASVLNPALKELSESRPPRLERLVLAGRGAIVNPFPNVKGLSCEGLRSEVPFSTLAPQSLRSLRLVSNEWPELGTWLQSLDAKALTEIELLDLGTKGVHGLEPLIERQVGLSRLHLEDDLVDDLARWLAVSPVLKTLDHLALGGPSTDEGLDAILVNFARFSRLKSLVLYGGRYTPATKRMAYRQLPQIRFDSVRPIRQWT